MISKKTTYLLGAGASANALPLAVTQKERMFQFLYMLDPDNGTSDMLKQKFTKSLYEKYAKSIQGIEDYITVDSFARSVQESTNRMKIHKFNEFLNLYFLFEQFDINAIYKTGHPTKYAEPNIWDLINNKFDQRYISFISKIYNNGFNENVNIISWNYDCQLEIALSKYLRTDFYDAKSRFNIYPHDSRQPFDISDSKFKFIKLNGSSGLWFRDSKLNESQLEDNVDLENLLRLVNSGNDFYSTTSYAWDNSLLKQRSVNISNAILKNTDQLVIIGYSFPDFNYEIDSSLFEGNQIKRIYIQVPENSYPDIEYRVKPLVNEQTSIELCKNPIEFYIPIHLKGSLSR